MHLATRGENNLGRITVTYTKYNMYLHTYIESFRSECAQSIFLCCIVFYVEDFANILLQLLEMLNYV